MSNRNQTGGGLIYRGTNAIAPPNCTFNNRPPTQYDSKNYSLLDLWLDEPNDDVWILVALRGTSTSKGTLATWVRISVGASGVFFLQGNDGIDVPPNGAGVLFLIGTNPISVDSGPANTETITIATATTTQIGATTLASSGLTVAGIDTTHAVTPAGLQAKLGTQTNFGIPYGVGQPAAIAWTAAGTDGQLIIAATGGAPLFANLTSADGSVTITNGPNSIDLSTSGRAPYTVQTTDATPTTLASIAVPINQAITLLAEVIAATSDYSAAIGGTALATARRAGGALTMVGSPVIDLNEDSAGAPDFNVVVSGNNLILQVTGEAATTYNWKAFVEVTTV